MYPEWIFDNESNRLLNRTPTRGKGGWEPGRIGGVRQERKGQEVDQSSQKVGIIYRVLKYCQKQEPKMLFDLHLPCSLF